MSDLPLGWVEAPLEAVVSSSVGGIWGSADQINGDIPVRVIRGAEFRDWASARAASAPRRFVPKAAFASRQLNVGDIVLEVSGGGPTQPVGRTVLIDDQAVSSSDMPVVCSNFCRRLVLTQEMDSRFIWYQLQYGYARNYTDQFQRATTNIRNLQVPQYLAGTTLAIPPRAEQERIVASIEHALSQLDAGSADLERIPRNISRMRAALLEAAVTAADAAVSRRVRLGDVLREPLRNGHSAKANGSGGVRIWTLTAVTKGDFGLHNSKITSADPRRVRDLWVQPGDLLIERSNTRELVGTACMYAGAPDVAVYPDLVIRARVSESVTPKFAELMLQAPSARRYFQRRAQGISGTMPKIDQATIQGFVFPLPSPQIQEEILQWTDTQLSAINVLERSLSNASNRVTRLRLSVLAAALSGKLVPQDPNDEPASVMLDRISVARRSSNGHQERARKPRLRVHS